MGKSRSRNKSQTFSSRSLPPRREVPSKSANESDNDKVLLPQPFPSHLPRPPKGSFLKNESPYRDAFQKALTGPYEGFVVDDARALQSSDENGAGIEESTIQSSLESMREDGYFRTDVTQPFGLGTKCAKTYVTRCLIGAPGTTYKYLGLRMFAHPWESPSINDDREGRKPNKKRRRDHHDREKGGMDRNPVMVTVDSVKIRDLSKSLSQRTLGHLRSLDKSRTNRGVSLTKGRPDFDVCLINRMESSPDLKPYVGEKDDKHNRTKSNETKTSVSWHADSSLEHFSTIAVYQTLLDGSKSKGNTKTKKKQDGQWWVALRVAHHSEGPQASQRRRGTNTEASIVEETPPIAASLPSGSAYYLLDDFNHHHQHTVLTTGDAASAGIRYSCTFRLLRDSHNIQDWIDRGKTAIRQFHKKGPKMWRSEQLLLTEIESEWIRQFYIQGSGNYDLLWDSYWKTPMSELLSIWSQLEERTKQTMDLLRAAAEGKCGVGNDSKPDMKSTKVERKARDRRKKSLGILQDLVSRLNLRDDEIHKEFYEPFARLVEDRAEMRELWAKREKDHVFHEMPLDCRPMHLPFEFAEVSSNEANLKGEVIGKSPLPGSPIQLKELCKQLVQCGQAYKEGNISLLPSLGNEDDPKKDSGVEAKEVSKDSHAKPMDWFGWNVVDKAFGLELQDPWAGAVVDGTKAIETRSYPLPPSLIGKKIEIIQSASGKAGVSGLGDRVEIDGKASKIIGWCTFSSMKRYTDEKSFRAEEDQHLVQPDSGYGWQKGVTKTVYGWIVGEHHRYRDEVVSHTLCIRRFRSLFELHPPKELANDANVTAARKRTKRSNSNKRNKTSGNRKRKRY